MAPLPLQAEAEVDDGEAGREGKHALCVSKMVGARLLFGRL